MTLSTCWPQPAQVVLPHVVQGVARHMVGVLSWGHVWETLMVGRTRRSQGGHHQAALDLGRSGPGGVVVTRVVALLMTFSSASGIRVGVPDVDDRSTTPGGT